MPKKIRNLVVAIVTVLIFTNLATLALLWKGHREKFPSRSKPHSNLTIVAERVPNSAATPDFNFTKIPSPSGTNATTFARLSLVAGRPGGFGPRILQMGHLPSGPDAPDENFFFQDGTYGGRLLMDFNHAVAIQQVNTYSWHTGARGPQVYRLYALDGVSSPEPVGSKDPATLGWKFLADVDTRPGSGDLGGQYGVSISSPNGLIGHYRFLLFDFKRTEEADRWGNTFYSKIDVITN